MARFSLAVLLLCLAICDVRSSSAQRTFNLNNACAYTVWPGTLSNAGTATLWQGGTTLAPGAAYQYVAPAGWAGRLWGRTGCSFDAANAGVCETGDCGAGLYCNGAGGVPPATLVEFTLDGYGGQDFYDVSLVDGYNLPLSIQAVGGTSASNGTCGSPGCATDLNTICPLELQETVNGAVVACKSACEVFQTDNYCCSGTFNSPSVCVATNYSQTFKSACPTAYSYAFDDVSSTFTCPGAPVYTITFCPSGTSTGAGTPPAVNATVPPPPLVIAAPPPPPLSNLSTPPPLALVPPPPPLVLVPPPPSVTSLIPPPPPNVTSLIPPPPPNVTSLIPPPPPNTTGLLYPPPPPPLNSSGLLYPPPPPPLNVTGLYPPPPPPLGFIYPPPPPFTVANGPYSPPVVVEAPPYDSGTTNSAAKFSVSVSFQVFLLLCCYLAIAWPSN